MAGGAKGSGRGNSTSGIEPRQPTSAQPPLAPSNISSGWTDDNLHFRCPLGTDQLVFCVKAVVRAQRSGADTAGSRKACSILEPTGESCV